jgi:hypothetical protein
MLATNFGEFYECELPRMPKRRSSQNTYSKTFVNKGRGGRASAQLDSTLPTLSSPL